MTNLFQRAIFPWFLLCLVNLSFAQQPNFEFGTLKSLAGITNSNTTAIAEDSFGFLWIGTEEGLFRFDGKNVFPYFLNINDPQSLPSNSINHLVVDRADNLWVSTSTGICKYNREFDNFLRISDQSEMKGFENCNIKIFALDKNGKLFVEYKKTIYGYDQGQQRFSKVVTIENGKISSIVFDGQNNMWIASKMNGGLFCFDQEKQQLKTFLNNPSDNQSISINEINCLVINGQTLWIGTSGKGIDAYDLKTKKFQHYVFSKNLENYINSIYVSPSKKVWVCTFSCLKLFNPSRNIFWDYYYDPENPHAVAKSLQGFYEDREGNYWTIHSIGGVRIARNNNKFSHIEGNAWVFWTTSEKIITALAYDSLGRLWIGNYYNGIDIFNWQKRQTIRLKHDPNNPRSIAEGTIFSIFCDSKKQTWVGSYLGGLQKYNSKANDFESYRHNPDDTLSIAMNDVRSIAEERNGDLWLAIQGEGVDRFDIKTHTFKHYTPKNNLLNNELTFQVLVDSRDNLWVATALGLGFLAKGKQIFKNYLYNPKDTTTLSNSEIHTVYEDKLHNIWVGTNDGLNKFNYETQTFSRYSAGLQNKHIASIISDNNNNIWVSTSAGISMFDPLTLKFTNYDQNYGLLSKVFIDRSCLKDNPGTLFFGGSQGFDMFNPVNLKPETRKPTVYLTDFRLFNKSISFRSNNRIIDRYIGEAKKINLNYDENAIDIFYQGINLTEADNIVYTYKLDGVDHAWVYAGGKRDANYINLGPGKYTFRVKAKFENGEWNPTETRIELNVLPAWWMTFWFKALLTLLILTAPVLFFYFRIKLLRIQKEKLALLVNERTEEIFQKNELLENQALQLENSNAQLKKLNATKNKLFSLISHDLRSPFHTILGFQSLLVSKYNDFSNAERRSMINKMYSKTNQVYHLVENLLNWSRVQTNGIQPNPSRFLLKELILKKFEIYRAIAEEKGISIQLQLPDGFFVYADMSLLETIIRNLINNAIKFTRSGGTILITTGQIGNEVTISVIDTGIGMTQGQIDSLFVFDQSESIPGTDGEKGSGLGLMLCKEFVEKSNGTMTIDSTPGKGSTFTIVLPAEPGT